MTISFVYPLKRAIECLSSVIIAPGILDVDHASAAIFINEHLDCILNIFYLFVSMLLLVRHFLCKNRSNLR